jgi:predicted alpha/beta-hydrolase family hydrolase
MREEIVRVKHLAYCSSESVIQTGAIDTLATFGEQAFDAINEATSLSSVSDGIKEHGLKTIEYIKENSS